MNRMIVSMVQHSQFQSTASRSSARDSIIDTLNSLFKSHPTNTAQANHVTPLVRVYHGTQSLADRQLLSIFSQFERQRRVSVATLLTQWSANPGVVSTTAYEALTSLDAGLVYQTFLNFPQSRPAAVETLTSYPNELDELHDPVFVMLLLGACLAEGYMKTSLAWFEVCKTNSVSLTICALSSKDVGIRKMAMTTLTYVWRAFQVRSRMRYCSLYAHEFSHRKPNSKRSNKLSSYSTNSDSSSHHRKQTAVSLTLQGSRRAQLFSSRTPFEASSTQHHSSTQSPCASSFNDPPSMPTMYR